MLKLKRAWCLVAHWRGLKLTNGFGWQGLLCPKCGYSFFYQWEDDFKDLTGKQDQ